MKNTCSYCYGHGINKFFWDHGIARKDGTRMPMRNVLKRPSADAYACDRCGLPKNLPSPPK